MQRVSVFVFLFVISCISHGQVQDVDKLEKQAKQASAQGRWHYALSYYQQAAQLAPDRLDFHFEMAKIYFNNNLFPETEQHLNHILSQNPNHLSALLHSGYLQMRLKNWPEAKLIFEKMIRLDAKHPSAHEALSNVLERLGDAAASAKAYEKHSALETK